MKRESCGGTRFLPPALMDCVSIAMLCTVINQLPDAAWNPWLPSMPKIERELSMTGSSCGLVSMVEAVIITGPALLLAEVSRNKGELGRFADVKFFVGSSLGKEGLDLHASAHLDQSGR